MERLTPEYVRFSVSQYKTLCPKSSEEIDINPRMEEDQLVACPPCPRGEECPVQVNILKYTSQNPGNK